MAHFPPLLTLPKIQNDVSVWSKIESSAQPKIIWQFLFTKSTELIRRVSFTKQPSLINNKPVHFVFYRDVCRIIQPHIVSTTGIHEPKLVEQSNAYFFSFRSKWKQFYRYITGNILIGGIWTGMFVELDTLTEHDRY